MRHIAPISRLLKHLLVGTSAALVIACTTVSTAPSPDLAAKIQNAKTPADHEELAAIYERDAQEALGQAKLHRQMARNYSSMLGGRALGSTMPSHCESTAQKYEAIAEEKKTLAKLHRDMAAQGGAR